MKRVLILSILILGLSANKIVDVIPAAPETAAKMPIYRPQQVPLATPQDKCCKDCGTLDVTGVAKISITADSAILFSTFCFKAKTAEEALRRNNERVNPFISEIQKLDSQIVLSTENISISEIWEIGKDNIQRRVGWQACVTVVARFSNIQLLARVIDIASSKDVTSMYNQFTISDELNEKKQSHLLKVASENAKAKAEFSAKHLGCRVVCVKTVTLDEPYTPQLYERASTVAADSSTTVIPGNVSLSRNVRVTFFLRCN